jgi:hypothetical protein
VDDNPALTTTGNENDLKLTREVEKRPLYRMAKARNLLEMWRGSQTICATQMESWAQNMQLAVVGYISDTEETFTASWSKFQYDAKAPFRLSE